MKKIFFLFLICFITTLFVSAQKIAAGSGHALAICDDSTVWSWGWNLFGQLGDNTSLTRTKPVKVHGSNNIGFLKDIIQVTTGEYNSMALKKDSTVWSWGYNCSGSLGDSTLINRATPVQVHGPGNIGFLKNIIAISGAKNGCHYLALRSDSTVWSWGYNFYSELGNNTNVDSWVPIQVHGPNNVGFLTGVIAISAGTWHSLALKSDGTVWAWGGNSYGQLGNNVSAGEKVPIQVHGIGNVGFLTNIVALSAGGKHSMALKNDSTVLSWGDNTRGQLGDNAGGSWAFTPLQVHGENDIGLLNNITNINACSEHSLAIKNDSTLFAWGENTTGSLGDSTNVNKPVPTKVHGKGNVGFLNDIIEASGNYTLNNSGNFTLAMKKDHSIWTFGRNNYGQLGDNTLIDKYVPVQPVGFCNIFPTIAEEHYMQSILNIFPNPSSSSSTLHLDKALKNATLNLYNSFGQQVKEMKNISGQTITLQRENLPGGLYFIRLTESNQVIATDKLIITD